MSTTELKIPRGYCQCGCGGRTTISQYNDKWNGRVRGEPMRYIRSHGTQGKRGLWGIASDLESAYNIDKDTGCWEWQRSRTSEGYGQLWDGKRMAKAHRYFYELYREKIPVGLQIDHLCRNRSCVNPDHLEAVTNAENGQRGKATKLTKREVAEIRWLRKLGLTYKLIGEIFGVTKAHASYVANYKCWR